MPLKTKARKASARPGAARPPREPLPRLPLKVLLYPHPFLRRAARPVEKMGDAERTLVAAMFETMKRERGIGLAATQVGWDARVFVARPDQEKGPDIVFINPEILDTEESLTDEEGCLSLPGIRVPIARARRVRARAFGLDGKPFEIETADLGARVIQHELDHLDGILFIDRMTPARRLEIRRKLKDLEDRGAGAD